MELMVLNLGRLHPLKSSCRPPIILHLFIQRLMVSAGRGSGVLSILQQAPFVKETVTDTVNSSKPGGRKHEGSRDLDAHVEEE